ncbi:uncharacterized protein CPUR_06748 [Claviceps purpurea 20.1]|uniref:Uncharacterized protein n=1 Tax=Claviceps purpurea (strain 20.1) TaxID=1111077 RepID=M1VXE5_CLAP2|nr:uncharacterized protein CPUR_06748 [Claviceps purpurea 20.1]
MATPPQGVGNSADLHTPVNATQGARDFLVDDGYQFDFDHIHGLTPAAFGSTLPDSPRLQSPGGTPVTVGQDADRLITELDLDPGKAHVQEAHPDVGGEGEENCVPALTVMQHGARYSSVLH